MSSQSLYSVDLGSKKKDVPDLFFRVRPDVSLFSSDFSSELRKVTRTVEDKWLPFLHEQLNYFKEAMNACDAEMYVIKENTIYHYKPPVKDAKAVGSDFTAYFDIGPLSTLPAYVAQTNQEYRSNKGVDKQLFPLGLGRKVSKKLCYVLCLPVSPPNNDKPIAVYEISRTHRAISDADLELAKELTLWMKKSWPTSTVEDCNRTTNYLHVVLNILRPYFVNCLKVETYLSPLLVRHFNFSPTHELVRSNLNLRKYILKTEFNPLLNCVHESVYTRFWFNATHVSFYRIIKNADSTTDKESDLTVIPYLLNPFSEDELLVGTKPFPLSELTGLLYVMQHKSFVKLTKDEIKQLDIYILLHEKTNVIIWYPIIKRLRVQAILELQFEEFTSMSQIEKEILDIFSKTVILAEECNECALENIKSEHAYSVFNEMLLYQSGPCSHDIKTYHNLNNLRKLPDFFKKIAWYPNKSDEPYIVDYILHMFIDLLGFDFVSTELYNIANFVLTVRNSYRLNPYHNFEHAFITMHTIYLLVSKEKKDMKPYEIIALLIGSLCHDIDHPGLTNAFLKMSFNKMWLLYREDSVLEWHHSYTTKKLIENTHLLVLLPKDMYCDIMNLLHRIILATDLTSYLDRYRTLSSVGQSFKWHISEHRQCLFYVMTTAADLSGNIKPFPVSRKIVLNLYEEFYLQGDIEQQMHIELDPMMDRRKYLEIGTQQAAFSEFIILPLYRVLVKYLPSTSGFLQAAENIRMIWDRVNKDPKVLESIIAKVQQETRDKGRSEVGLITSSQQDNKIDISA